MKEGKRITSDLKKFLEFCEARELLHLDWFGKVSWNQNDESNPLIHLFLSPLTEKKVGGKIKRQPDKSRQEQIALGIGYLPYLSIGNVFHKGKLAPKSLWPKTQAIQFRLDTSHLNAVTDRKLSSLKEKGDYWVSHKAVNKKFWGFACDSRYKTLRGTYLRYDNFGGIENRIGIDVVIHEIELITYYYARTSNLAKAAFKGYYTNDNIEKKIICTKRHRPTFDSENGTASFIHQHGLHREDMPTIGRIFFTPNQFALQGAWRIGKSAMSHGLADGNGISYGYPTTIIPFEGATTLTLEGRWLKKREDRWTFLANKIIDCTYPFPFRRLEYRDAVDPRGPKADQDEVKIFHWPTHQQNSASDDNGASVSNEQPSSDSTIFIDLPDRSQSALDKIELVRQEPEKCTHQSAGLNDTNSNNVQHPNMSTGDASSRESSSHAIKIQSDLQVHTPVNRNLEDFVKSVQITQSQNPDWNIENVTIGTPHLVDGLIYSCFPKIRNKRSKSVMQFSFHDKAKTKVRRYICYEITINDRFGYLFNGESRTRLSYDIENGTSEHMSILFLRTKAFERIESNDFIPFITLTVKGGAWPTQARLEKFVRYHTTHPGTKSCMDISRRLTSLVERGFKEAVG
ncbi:MAG: hypothetical protein JAY75_11740 [Candidatus Thiodiazotropha taylori]|nr:hypothetical protein [Candidatus Thiodiazotropha taylori]MCW4226767.1 hypothetical protein [Candidatus Thiodiazotropha endolucinida]MCG7888329.1 hypothetical protein [Candidatus Thiodiazotropha taylori]MCG7890748.1 hypothetical protein [Candidatus Thiodiazotropha taylori]MCG8032709.1 hypothetical protein [Candidatus Thiodiazotropha taylori]